MIADLVGNAPRHEGAPVTVSPRGEARSPGPRVLVTQVAASGPGIRPDVPPQVFDRFHKADAARTRSAGSGPGPAIARKNVRLYGGTVRAGDLPGAAQSSPSRHRSARRRPTDEACAMAAQPALSLGSLEAVLSEAAMSLANLVRLGVAPTTTLLGVTRAGGARPDGRVRGDRCRLTRPPRSAKAHADVPSPRRAGTAGGPGERPYPVVRRLRRFVRGDDRAGAAACFASAGSSLTGG
ncbi:hypothetical protein GCM10023238_30310 [Streptomyces heliomycini]